MVDHIGYVDVCPICKSKAKPLDKVGDANRIDCPTHGRFKVAGTIWSIPSKVNATREHWEAALTKAKKRAEPDKWPFILTYDLP